MKARQAQPASMQQAGIQMWMPHSGLRQKSPIIWCVAVKPVWPNGKLPQQLHSTYCNYGLEMQFQADVLDMLGPTRKLGCLAP